MEQPVATGPRGKQKTLREERGVFLLVDILEEEFRKVFLLQFFLGSY